MHRRAFLQMASLSGLGVVVAGGRQARSAEPYAGPFWVCINASGGWNPSSLCDPKGNPIDSFAAADIRQQGSLLYSPYRGPARTVQDPLSGQSDDRDFFDRFFQRHGQRLLVVNGIDMGTNNHEEGNRYVWSGIMDGQAAFPALAAAATRPDLAMAFLSNGATYERTDGLIAVTRVSSASGAGSPLEPLYRIGVPNELRPGQAAGPTFHRAGVWDDLVKPAINRRLLRLRETDAVPHRQQHKDVLYTIRTADSALEGLVRELSGVGRSGNPLVTQIQIALAAFKAGLAVSANVSRTGFDTHGDHDREHYPRLDDILRAMDYLITRAADLGLADKLYVVVGSEFGRTPGYNGTNGKDHWPVTSMLFWGPGIRGNRMVGGTDSSLNPLRVHPATLAPDPQGLLLRPEHIHRAMRRLAGVHEHPLASRLPLGDAEDLDIFA